MSFFALHELRELVSFFALLWELVGFFVLLRELVSFFALVRELVSFDSAHVTNSPPDRKSI